jgi:putative ABC transport system substrate-binding protein
MRRRDFTIGLALAAAIRSARAQESNRTFRLGISAGAGTSRQQPSWLAFFDELGKAGFIEDKNLIVDWRLVASRPDEIAASVAEQVQWARDALVTGPLVVAAVQAATRTIPILCVSDDMVANGLVPSLARPGGNLTGISILASELDGKRQEILMELVPASRHSPISIRRRFLKSRLCEMTLRRAVSNYRSIRSARPRRSPPPLTLRRPRAPLQSTCWLDPSFTLIAR